jgi:hypothetical protein
MQMYWFLAWVRVQISSFDGFVTEFKDNPYMNS